MNFSHFWKMVSGLPMTHAALIVLLLAGSIVGACIALWNVVPLAFEYSRQRWGRHIRRRARKRWYGATRTPLHRAEIEDQIRVPPLRMSHTGVSLKAWLAVAGVSVVSVLAGVGLGYLLNRQPDYPSVSAQLANGVRDSVRLRIDHDLRKR
jgi:hypothetical protein